jgi:hypothetical protein
MCEMRVKVAVAAGIRQAAPPQLAITSHVPLPVQAPDQPLKVEPAAGVAVKRTGVRQG